MHTYTDGSKPRALGICIVGLGGAVATTAVAGIELLRAGHVGVEGLPLATLPAEFIDGLADYESIVFGGWDLSQDNLAQAAATHNVLTAAQLQLAESALGQIVPFAAVGNLEFCRNIEGTNQFQSATLRDAVETIRGDLRRFRHDNDLEQVVCINLASTTRWL